MVSAGKRLSLTSSQCGETVSFMKAGFDRCTRGVNVWSQISVVCITALSSILGCGAPSREQIDSPFLSGLEVCMVLCRCGNALMPHSSARGPLAPGNVSVNCECRPAENLHACTAHACFTREHSRHIVHAQNCVF